MTGFGALILGLVSLFAGLLSVRGVVHDSQSGKAKILFVGDMMFDRSIRSTINAKGGGYIFSCIDDLLRDQDMVVGNLEGPITDNASVSIGSLPGDGHNFTFAFPPTTAPLLYTHNIRMVNIGNNHILNFSHEGAIQTKQYLDAASVSHFGDPDSSEDDRVARVDIQGIPVSFVNWSEWTSGNADQTVAQVRKEAQSGRTVFVYTHWGEEYATTSLPRMRTLAHSFIDAGATMVIGSHPHVVEEREIYNGKYIYYSIGNFIFDQYWEDMVRHGLTLDVTFDGQGFVQIREIPVELGRDRRTCRTPLMNSSSLK